MTMPIGRIGLDFIVNSTKTGGQSSPSVATLPDGRFVVTWFSGDTQDLRARLYTADGSAMGPDFVVNSTIAGIQDLPSVTALVDGRFVVTWFSFDTGDGDGLCIRGRVYNGDGTPDLSFAGGND